MNRTPSLRRRMAGNDAYTFLMKELEKVDDVIQRLNGIRCGAKPTSCPDQLCRALEQL